MRNRLSATNLEKDGLVHVPYPTDLRSAVEKTVDLWKRFCTQSEGVKIQFPYQNIDGTGVGYELKKTHGSTLDLKEDFHVTLGASDWLHETVEKTENEYLSQFITSTESLVSLMKPLVINFAKGMEQEFDLEGFAEEVEESASLWVVRFLHYFGGSKIGDEIASAHADKSGLTLHLYESDPGLQYYSFKKIWNDMPVFPGETVIIPGMRGQYRSRNRLKATFHRVIATERTAIHGRFSVVCFIHLKRTPAYNKLLAGRLQEFPPGFNYDMPFEQFSKLFTV